MIALGIDPDTTTTGFGLLRDGRAIYGGIIEVPKGKGKAAGRLLAMVDKAAKVLGELRLDNQDFQHVDVIVIEGQVHYPRSKVRPNDLIALGRVAGALLAVTMELWPMARIELPEPRDWKGTVPKGVFTKRILKNLELAHDPRGGLCYVPTEVGLRLPGTIGMTKTNAGHCIDALGLARWGTATAGRTTPRSR